MSIQTQIDRLKQAKADLIAQIEAKGVTVPADASLDDLAALVEAISTGVDLPTLTTPATETEVFDGYEYIDETGAKKTGTFTVEEEMTAQDTLIADIMTALEGKAGGSGGGAVETCNVTITTDSKRMAFYIFTTYENDSVGYKTTNKLMAEDLILEPVVIENVVCGSSFVIYDGGSMYDGDTITGGAVNIGHFGSWLWYQAPTEPGDCTIHIKQD